jgi:hypothetical protein
MRWPSGWISSNGIGRAGIPETRSNLFRKENSNKADIVSTFIFVCLFVFICAAAGTFQILVLYFRSWSVFVVFKIISFDVCAYPVLALVVVQVPTESNGTCVF